LLTNLGFIWDIDGVLVDSPHEEAWRNTLMKDPWNGNGMSSDFYFTHVASIPRYEGGNNILELKGIYERLGAKTKEEKQKLLDKFCNEKNDLIRKLIREDKFKLFTDAVTQLLRSKKLGVWQGAASASKNAKDMLMRVTRSRVIREIGNDFGVFGEHDTLNSMFDVNLCGIDASHKKEIQKSAAQQLDILSGEKIEKFVVFEDAPAGIKAANSLGYYTVGVLRIGKKEALQTAGADVVVRDLKKIKIEEILTW
jgi:Predicted phosphatase/phosphohexomutase